MARAFMNILSLSDLGDDLGLKHPPVIEMFLPMTVSADQLFTIRNTFTKVAAYHHDIFHENTDEEHPLLKMFEVTPLVEDTDNMFHIERILEPYWSSLVEQGKDLSVRGQRIFLARSDPALNAGLVPAVLAIKVALSTATALGERYGFAVHPIVGTGSLPFRGSVNPLYTDTFLEQYSGVRTYSIQSAFRYDYEREKVDAALQAISREAPKREVLSVPEDEKAQLWSIIETFSDIWKASIEPLAPLINKIASYVPARRERVIHTGLFGYSRGVGEVKLPRAIKFTAALYSLGVPPELIATGRGLKKIAEAGQLELLEKYYPAIRNDLQHAGKHLNRENLTSLAASNPVFADVQQDIDAIEEVLGIELGPEKPRHIIHRNHTSTIYQRLTASDLHDDDRITKNIVLAGIIRRSLG